MIEKCISCGADIPESMQACPACETAIKKPMEWVQIAFCDWEAKGADGDFRVWKDGRVWKGRYRSNDKTYTFFLPPQRSARKMKDMCEDNHYWEG